VPATLRAQLIERLVPLGVEDRVWPGRDDGFSALYYQGKSFAHFHDDHELDIRLTQSLIRRERLVRATNSRVHPDRSQNSQWIEIPFASEADISRIVLLVKLAIAELGA
jgi:hypothetical protein